MNKYKILISILFYSTGFFLSAQEVTLRGSVQDSLHNPLVYVNIIATPLSDNQQITFSISDEAGNYELEMTKDISYKLSITHLGYSQLIDTIQLSQNAQKNFVLDRSTQTLEEVLVEAKMAMIVKEDTITYRVDNFRTGKERKLRELLKNLPGVEVDRAGNVSVNGEKVTKLLVEGETFFTGDTKLGVNNIPADAVEEVTVLDDYHEVPFLKNLSESDEMALNIKLKEGKKKFVFGEIEAGGGVKERYLFHPTLFYYSPKTSVNLIGDFNNIGKKSFTIQDYIDFEGGIGSFMNNFSAYFDLFDSDFAQFLSQRDFQFQKNQFGALSLSQEISPNLRVSAYSINSIAKTRSKTTQEISYLTQENLDESRINTNNNELFFSLNKLELSYNPNYETDLTYETVVKASNGDAYEYIGSETIEDTTQINTFVQPKSVSLSQNIEFNKQFSYEHTSTLSLNYTYRKTENTKDWFFDQPVFSEIIPFINENGTFNLKQNTTSRSHVANFRLKHYWVLNNLNHIYPVVGMQYHNKTYGTLDYQQLQNGINNFQNSGFNNELDFRLVDNYIGFEYKRKLGNLILKPGLIYHYFIWNIKQFGPEIANKSEAVLLPKFSAKIDLNSGQKLQLDYKMRTSFADASQYATRLRLQSFNQLYQGNEDLENELFHQLSFRFSRFNLFEGTFINAGINYTYRLKSVQNTTILEGIDQISHPIYSDLPQSMFSVNGSYAKQIENFKFTLRGNASLSDYSRKINTETIDYNSQNYFYTFKTETRFEKWPNIEIGWKQGFSIFSSTIFRNEFVTLDPYAYLEYDFWNDFILKADYTYNYYENKNMGQINRFQIGGASLSYWKEDSLWSFKLSVENLFDVRYKNENSFNQFLVSDRNIFIQPRTVLFKIAYKL